jgi:prepilin peptidase dependent protein B
MLSDVKLPLTRPFSARSAARGLSIVELMIGVAIGLVVVAGGAKLLADGLVGNRRNIVETRITQDLRAATDMVARDLRRAGYWGNRSYLGVAATPTANAYAGVSPIPSAGTGNLVEYSYIKDSNDSLDSAEYMGFTIAADPGNGISVLYMKLGRTGATDNWQPLTDSRVVNVTAFNVRPITSSVSLGDMCVGSTHSGTPPVASAACCQPHPANLNQCKPDYFRWDVNGYTQAPVPPAGKTVWATCPELVVRSFDITIVGQGVPPNQDVRREITESVRVRNDEVRFNKANCPP